MSELIVGVNVALGNFTTSRCPAFDADGDGHVRIDDLVRAVSAGLNGCPGTPTPTATLGPDCSDPGADPSTNCTSCKPRFHIENAFGIPAPEGLYDGGDAPGGPPPSAADERRHCVPDSFCAPSSVHCSGRGTCVDLPGGTAGCDCPEGYGGVNCERCLPPYTPVPGGTCARGGGCNETLCNGHGTCVVVGGTTSCDCDPGFGGARCTSSFVLVPVGHSVEVGQTLTLSTVFLGPSECGPAVDWLIVAGGGSIVGNERTAPYTAPNAVQGLVDIVTVRAAPQNCPELADETSIHVVLAGVGPIVGQASAAFEGVDEAVLQFMQDHGIPGGAMTLSFQEVRVYNKAFGFALPFALPGLPAEMTPGHILRLASVSKPITRAAIRELQAAGLLTDGANGLNDAVFDILQIEGNNLLGLDGSNVPVQPLVDADYLGGTPTLCDGPQMCPAEGAPPLNCPLGSVQGGDGGLVCPLNLNNAVDGFTIETPTWNVDGDNPRLGGSPQYDCPTDDTGQLDVAMWQRMTVADLFWHRGGFYRGVKFNDTLNGGTQNGDPQAEPNFVAQRLPLDHAPPPNALDIIRFTAGACLYYPPLGCDDTCCVPGSLPDPVDPWGYCTVLDDDTYSNVGYNILGQIIAVKSGMPYADYVKQTVFDPLGIEHILPGKTRPQDRDPREPVYVANDDQRGGDLFDAVCEGGNGPGCSGGLWTFPDQIPKPDGGNFALEYRNPSGGWTATSCDLNRLFTTYRIVDGRRRTPHVFPGSGEGTMFGTYAGTRS